MQLCQHLKNATATALEAAARHARQWLESQETRHVGPRVTAADLAADFGGPLPAEGMPAAEVVDYLATKAEPGLMAMPSGRFFGWVIGGTLPAALAADWLVSAWDQNAVLRFATPATAAIEEAAGSWLLELLGLPEESDVGFATGATMANFTGLAAARWRLMADAGWDLDGDGLAGAPADPLLRGPGTARLDRPRPAVSGAGPAHGGPRGPAGPHQPRGSWTVPWPAPLNRRPAAGSGPAPLLVCLQAGNLHSGAFDPFVEAIAVAKGTRRLGPRGRRVRALGRGRPGARRADRRAAGRRFLGHRRAQDPQRAL